MKTIVLFIRGPPGDVHAAFAGVPDDTPSKDGEHGAKRMAPMSLNALVSHGAYNTFLDAKYNRGQANDEMYVQYMRGMTPTMKKTPLVYQKFENSLKASGIHVQPENGRLNVMALTSKDVKAMAGERECKSGETLRWEKDGKPIAGGLFDPAIFGMNGDRWGMMKPTVPLLNPVMEEPTRILLGLTQKELKSVMSGETEYQKYGTGMQAISNAASTVRICQQSRWTTARFAKIGGVPK